MQYESLLSEVKIGDYYLRLLLEEDQNASKIHKPYEFFNDIYHRFLLTTTVNMRCMCLQVHSRISNSVVKQPTLT